MSILDTNISRFKDYSSPSNPETVNMLDWLRSDEYADTVERLRTIDDKKERDKLKGKLPAITPSGLFRYRNCEPENLIKHSGLLQFDIDMKGNEHIGNYDDLKRHICNISNVAYCGLSASGRGYWGLVPLAYPERHTEQFWGLYNGFKSLGLTLDTKPKDIHSLRGYSHDLDGYFNHDATVFTGLADDPEAAAPSPEKKTFKRSHRDTGKQSDVERQIEIIQENRTDITAGIDNWLRLGYGFANEFGEAGREYFHAISQYHPEYSERETNHIYNSCLRGNRGGVTIDSFFYLAKKHGLTVKGNRDRSLQAKYESDNSAPHGLNEWTGEVFDERGYPSDWDDIAPPEPGTPEHQEMIRIELQEMGSNTLYPTNTDDNSLIFNE